MHKFIMLYFPITIDANFASKTPIPLPPPNCPADSNNHKDHKENMLIDRTFGAGAPGSYPLGLTIS